VFIFLLGEKHFQCRCFLFLAHYIKNSYPDLLIKFEENLASKKKPVKTRKAAKTSTAATQEQQQPITNFFAQGKMKGQLKGTKGITSSDDPKRHQPEVLTEASD